MYIIDGTQWELEVRFAECKPLKITAATVSHLISGSY
jgi:hypothetical protein